MEEREYWIALNALAGMGAGQKLSLINHFGSPQDIFQSKAKVAAWPECRPQFIDKLRNCDPEALVRQEEKKAQIAGVRIITLAEQEFPHLLKEIYDPPLALYIKGMLPVDTRISLAIVGSRIASYYGQLVTERIVQELLAYGFWITSGLARGIDSIAHRAAIKGEGKTIAVLGSSLDIIYPPENKKLMELISENGAVISEFAFGTEPHKMNFPIRNRIISGLSPGVLVVEAREKSGALITANCALEQGREVLAIPGNIYSPNSQGTNQLIKQGARLVQRADDILEELGYDLFDSGKPSNSSQSSKLKLNKDKLNKEESKVASLLSYDPMPIDLIIQKSEVCPGDIHTILLTLEMKGIIKQLPGKLFCKI